MDSITFRVPRPEDKESMAKFLLDVFRVVEPVSVGIGLCRDCFGQFILSEDLNLINNVIESKLSLIAEVNGEIVGGRLVSISERPKEGDKPLDLKINPCKNCINKGEVFNRFIKMLMKMKTMTWQCLPPNVNKLVHREISAVEMNYQRKGIGKLLSTINLSDGYLKSIGFDGIISETSSIANQQLLRVMGFKPLAEEKYADYGIRPSDGCTSLILNFKKL
uniref:N-acetyltransferase domain-containing protein n=1 Tax=Parastrongyloides trichosuri TaxID=131310 RepID=A0A0N4Z4Z9_PARTI